MKKLTLFLLILLTILIFFNSNIIIETNIYAVKLFKSNVFPTLFPFFILSDVLINYGFIEFSSTIFKPIMNKIFKINKDTSFILIMSMISGFPSSAKYTKDLYDNNIINSNEASKILMFTHFSNPLFIIGTIGTIYLKNIKLAVLILIIHYISNIIVGFIFRNYIKTPINNNINYKRKTYSLSYVLKNAITNSFNTLFLILGTIIIFLTIVNLIDNYLPLNPLFKTIINGILEMTGGINNISYLSLNNRLKCTIIGMFLSFGGLSVHMQIKSIISNTDIKYTPYLLARTFHSLITSILIYTIFTFV